MNAWQRESCNIWTSHCWVLVIWSSTSSKRCQALESAPERERGLGPAPGTVTHSPSPLPALLSPCSWRAAVLSSSCLEYPFLHKVTETCLSLSTCSCVSLRGCWCSTSLTSCVSCGGNQAQRRTCCKGLVSFPACFLFPPPCAIGNGLTSPGGGEERNRPGLQRLRSASSHHFSLPLVSWQSDTRKSEVKDPGADVQLDVRAAS